MKTLYLECNMGAAGDMLMAALYELMSEAQKKRFLHKMNHLIDGLSVTATPSQKCGIWGTHMDVIAFGEEEMSWDHLHAHLHGHAHTHEHHHHDHDEYHHHDHDHDHHEHDHHHEHTHDHDHDHGDGHTHSHSHHHYSYEDICHLISHFDLPEKVKENAQTVYQLIGEAEAHAHNAPITQIHFHEVGSLDAVADVVGCCLALDMLDPEQILASPVHVGSGFVHCAHGVLPVPAPATAFLLQEVPSYSNGTKGELCTPTGAALLKHFVSQFGDMPVMTTQLIGYGMGKKDFEAANCVRAFWGETSGNADQIFELSCNLDDMTPEALGYAQEVLLNAGALDVFTAPIYMKKNRPAVMLTCLCRPAQKEALAKLMLEQTTTLGVRMKQCDRMILQSYFCKVNTPYGEITMKQSAGYDVYKYKAEYQEVKAAADAYGVSYEAVYREAVKAMEEEIQKEDLIDDSLFEDEEIPEEV